MGITISKSAAALSAAMAGGRPVPLLGAAFLSVWTLQWFAAPLPARGLGETPGQLSTILSDLRPDFRLYVREIRQVPRRRFPVTHYTALVRPGGDDPLEAASAPRPGRDHRNDILFYPDSFGIERTEGWRLLLLDHEYLHAKHLAEAHSVPLAGFGAAQADRHFFEAVAWGHNIAEARRGAYGPLAGRDWQEALGNYERHLEAFRQFVHRAQPSAWGYWSRFFPEPGDPFPSITTFPPAPEGSP
ncbi:MAG: hypothetical protein HY509_01495 [Acidobacteria bacterium]|nr:hypothetical protein [Acidobacteriota bacterium]